MLCRGGSSGADLDELFSRLIPGAAYACHPEPKSILVGSVMIRRRRLTCRSQKRRLQRHEITFREDRLILSGIGAAMLVFFETVPAFATGFFGPVQYLDNGGKNVEASPEFYWELEVKRLAGNFHPAEKLLLAKIDDSQSESESHSKAEATADADLKDFDQAILEGRIKPPDPAKARTDHAAARELIARTDEKTADSLPEEFESEFSDYHQGAFAYRRGKDHWDDARKAWERLLQRPESERKYRTVWAAFMLGKIALKSGSPDAVNWFQRTRGFARAGFADSLGMAADSYGWEGRAEWKQNHPERAAPLFLTQLALRDTSAHDQKALDDLRSAAKDPLLRSLVTADILATETTAENADASQGESESASPNRSARWLSVIKDANLEQVDEAEYLGWVAYNNGNYNEADRWLQLARNDSPAACWLRAKLQRRNGRLDEAAKSMALAWQSIHDLSHYTGWSGSTEDRYLTGNEEGGWTFDSAASGDFGSLRLERRDFVQALETFWRGGLWDDAAYVAEHVLSADELKAFVDRQPDAMGTTDDTNPEKRLGNLKYLLGRRLVREDRYDEAARYLDPPYDKFSK